MAIFTDEELRSLIKARCAGDGATKDEIAEFVDWCEDARINVGIVASILTGKVGVRKGADGDWEFRHL